MIRYRLNPIILLINNGGYTIEVGLRLESAGPGSKEELARAFGQCMRMLERVIFDNMHQ